MNPVRFPLVLFPIIALAACGQPAADSENADDYAARIGGTPSVAANGTPGARPTPASVATPAAGAAPGPFSPGTATDPQSRNCSAPAVAPFYGRPADQATRREVMEAVAPQTRVRFVRAGSSVEPDAGSDRLNIMLDTTGIIRDARCG